MPIAAATLRDVPSLLHLVNSAYRGDTSRLGWTTEADLLDGDIRTDEQTIREMIDMPGALFLLHTDENKEINGSVFLKQVEHKLYLGMLSVSPKLQSNGIGKRLMIAAEEFAEKNNYPAIFMRVISVRHELIAWYQRMGYQPTGETEPFPPGNETGTPTRPLEFIIIEKSIPIKNHT